MSHIQSNHNEQNQRTSKPWRKNTSSNKQIKKNSPCYLSERPCIQRLYEQSKMPSPYLDREEGKGKKENSAMEVESDLILPIYTDTVIFDG